MILRNRFIPILVLTGLALLAGNVVHAQVVVIANASVSADSISRVELRNVFTGASTKLKDGSHVKPVLLKEGPTHTEFVTTDLSMSVASLLVIWRGLVFSGQGAMPRTAQDESAMVAYVAQTPGAIGYVNRTTPHGGVRELSVR